MTRIAKPKPTSIDVPNALPQTERSWLVRLRAIALRPEATPFAGFIVTLIVFSFLSPLFLTKLTAITVASSASELGIVSVCVTVLMISGNFDLSVGAIVAVSGYGALWSLRHGMSSGEAVLVALALGVFVGLVNGILVVITKIHSFVVTLGTMLISYSLLNIAVQGTPTALGMSPGWEKAISGPNIDGFQMSLVWFVLLTALATFFLLGTRQGNWTYAMGQNISAARNLGVPVRSMTILLFAISGFGGAVLGIVQAARFNSVDGARGVDIELYVIAIIVMGGTSLFGGYGSAIGTLIGAIIYGMIQAGIVLAGAPGYYFDGLVGVGLFAAVLLNEFMLRNVEHVGRKRVVSPAGDSS